MICKWIAFWGPFPNMSHHLNHFISLLVAFHSHVSLHSEGPVSHDGDFCAAGASCFACSRTAESRRPGRLLPRQSLRPVPPSLSWSCVALYLFVLQFDKPSGEVVVCLPKIRHSMATVSNHTHTCTQAFVHKYSDMLAYAYVHLLMLNIVFNRLWSYDYDVSIWHMSQVCVCVCVWDFRE